jgi:UDP-N-acetylmuramate dehydrogenase
MSFLTDQQVQEFCYAFPDVKHNEAMSRHTNLRIGGVARLYLTAPSSDRLVQAVKKAEELAIPWYLFGGGSNLLVADTGFRGVVIQATDHAFEFHETGVTVAAGAITAMIARLSAERGFQGFEWAIGVPGTIGGAIYGNAGCYGGEMKDVVCSVDTFDVKEHRVISYVGAECGFAYRESRFKHQRVLILRTRLQFDSGDREASLRRIQEIIALRKEKQPLEYSSAGCLFKNADIDERVLYQLEQRIDVPSQMKQTKRISAGGWFNKRDCAV